MSDLPPLRIHLSPPDVGPRERQLLLDAFDSNWIAPLGPHVDAFEADVAAFLGGDVHTVALASGTAALHLALATGLEAPPRRPVAHPRGASVHQGPTG